MGYPRHKIGVRFARADRRTCRVLTVATLSSRTTSQSAGDGADAGHVLPFGVPARDAAGEQLVEQGVAQGLGGGDDRLGALDGLVDGVQHVGDGALLGQAWEVDRESPDFRPPDSFERTTLGPTARTYAWSG